MSARRKPRSTKTRPSRRALEEAHARYAQERDARLAERMPSHRPSGGVGGSSGGVKCLHAHYADFAAGNANPIGAGRRREKSANPTATSLVLLSLTGRCGVIQTGESRTDDEPST